MTVSQHSQTLTSLSIQFLFFIFYGGEGVNIAVNPLGNT
jgi:hypothetical protein